jgi:hypothetical protein
MIGARPMPPQADVQYAAHSFIAWVSGALDALSTIDYVLLGLALAIAYFLKRCLAVMTSAVPVEVELLDSDGTPTPPVHAITALLRERLAKGGLSAPVVPSGTPQAGLVDAVAASPIPQGAFIAKLMQALPIPTPLQYKLSGSINSAPAPLELCLWLRPDGRSRALICTVPAKGEPRATDNDQVIDAAAFAVYSFISTEALRAFPPWTRWHSSTALADYRTGLDAAEREHFADARDLLTEAAVKEPDNALVFLQLANVYERIAYPSVNAGGGRKLDNANRQAKTLRRYLWIADQWPWLVQARYRASVLAGSLAGSCQNGEPETIEGARKGLGLKADTDVEAVLISIARAESDFALQLLKPWYMLLRWRRTRSQFEPSAEERRQLKRAIGISRQALRIRRLPAAEKWPRRAANAFWVACSEVAVRCWHLSFGLIAVDWQTQYVAACFDSLLLGLATRRFSIEANEERNESPWSGGPVKRRRRWWLRHLGKHAFRRLDRAISDAGRSLPSSWVLDEDPDLQPLRDLDREWEAQTAPLRTRAELAATEPAGEQAPGELGRQAPKTTHTATQRVPLLCSPTRPWPKPGLRIAAYVPVAAAAVILDAALAGDGSAWLVALSALLAFCAWRVFLGIREGERRRTVAAALHAGAIKSRDRRGSRLP